LKEKKRYTDCLRYYVIAVGYIRDVWHKITIGYLFHNPNNLFQLANSTLWTMFCVGAVAVVKPV